MKKLLIFAVALLFALPLFAQSDYNYQKRSLYELLPVNSKDIVFLGNSITDGCEWAELFDNPHIKNRGISGDRSDWMLDRLDPIVKGQPRKLFLMIGTNDLSVGSTPQEVADNVAKVLDRFRAESPKTQLYVQSILPVNGVDMKSKHKNHWDKTTEIIDCNRLIQVRCAERNIPYIDLYAAMVDDKGLLDKRYTNDGLHLLGEGYLVWRKAIEKFVK